jgi:hypothetical protein
MEIYLNGFRVSLECVEERGHYQDLQWAVIIPMHRDESIATFQKFYPEDELPRFEFFFN